jgi:hypothetical protein
MRSLGFTAWQRSTMSLVERAKRRLAAEEVTALSVCLETTVTRLMVPHGEDEPDLVMFPAGLAISGGRLLFNDRSVLWDEKNMPQLAERPDRQAAGRSLAFEMAEISRRMAELEEDAPHPRTPHRDEQ